MHARIAMNCRNPNKIEDDHAVPKSNYWLWLQCLIKDAILEKRLVHDNRLLIGDHLMRSATDLKACHNRQLVEIGLIDQENAGI